VTELSKIPATVITGFLGAGKTTLIRNLMENANGKRIGLIINEFGDLGFDREIINGCGIEGCEEEDVMELANGCICCTVADDFLPTIEKLLDRDTPLDHIVIETSGLALPKPLVKAFNWPEIRSRVTVDGVVTVLDAPAVRDGQFAHNPEAVQAQREADEALDHDSPLEEVFEEQLYCADMVLLNKSDLLADGEIDGVHVTIREQLKKDAVKIVSSSHGKVDPAVLLGLGAAAEDDLESRPSNHDHHDHHHHDHAHDDHHHDHDHDHHHDDAHDHNHDQFESFITSVGEITDPAAFEKKLQAVVAQHQILRVKGILDIPGKPMRQVIQGVGGRFQRYFDRPWAENENRSSDLVIIGLHGLDQAAITAALKD
jgi:cobalamin biosynthesis protein CobW